ncbi:MAG: cupredoxin domain-containing protein [Pseudomonadota bacterium]|jgi:hypothetical protein
MTVILRRLAFVLAAACSGPAALAQELPTFDVVARDGRLIPARLEVPAGRRIKLVLKNEGPGPLEFENDEMRIEKVISAGVTSFIVLPPMKPGEYGFIDEFNPMTGELKIIAK